MIENYKKRTDILLKAENDILLQQVMIEKCKQDIFYFFEYFLYTERNANLIWEQWNANMPFILFDFQIEFVQEVWNSIIEWLKPVKDRLDLTDVFIEKSRQMWVSWMMMWIFLYWYMFHNHKYLIINQTGDDVDKKWDMKSNFEKLRFMIRYLPDWMLPKWLSKTPWSEYNKYMNISRQDWTWSINGEAWSVWAWRWWTYTAVFMDEMAYIDNATEINKSIASATPCRIFNSTPNWEFNEQYAMRLKAMEWEIKYLRLHWSCHPYYDQVWYDWRVKSMTPEQIAQELEINYNVAIKWRVYPEFQPWIIQTWTWFMFDYDYNLPLYISIDNSHWWEDPHAIIVAQTEYDSDKIRIIDCLQVNCSVTQVASILWKNPVQWFVIDDNVLDFYSRYIKYKPATFLADPYDTNATLNETTIYKEYAKYWIHLNLPLMGKSKTWSKIEEQITITRNNMHRFKINNRCKSFMSAIQNARYPEHKQGSNRTQEQTKPIHNMTSHYRSALEYLTVYLINQQEQNFVKQNKKVRYIETADPITWEMSLRKV